MKTLNRICMTGVTIFFGTLLNGCGQDELERLVHHETYSFEGSYGNQDNEDTITFKDGVMTYSIQGSIFTKSYTVDKRHVHIQLRNSSLEKREDLVMSIQNEGESLTCSSCAKYKLASVWNRLPETLVFDYSSME
ncbi:hypothetical protein [Vibrio proteolyticus]